MGEGVCGRVCVGGCVRASYIYHMWVIYVATAMAVKSVYPSLTAFTTATLSAHTVRGYTAFSTLQPVYTQGQSHTSLRNQYSLYL